MKFSIITPTIGHPLLSKLLLSVLNQKVSEEVLIEHIIVVDGPEFVEQVDTILQECPITNSSNLERYVIYLPYNTGKGGFLGHKIYSAITQLINGDYVILLDNDNYLDDDHVETYYKAIKKNNYDWMYCLRKICDSNGNYICDDSCESLGYLSNTFYSRSVFFIDTNCTCVKKEIATKLCQIWNHVGTNNEDNPDRVYSRALMQLYPNYECTFKYSVNYTVDNRKESVGKNMFLFGNQEIRKKYNGIPWMKKQLFIAHFDVQNTEKIIKRIYQKDKECIAFNQWNLNLLDQMSDHLCISAYNPFIPSNKKVLFHMCHKHLLPETVLERNDIEKILFTIEGPNIRHQEQWNFEFLYNKFSHIITYWKPFIETARKNSKKISYFPFIHRYDFTNINDLDCIKVNNNKEKNVCIILEKRDFSQKYKINNVDLQALDYLRWEYCSVLKEKVDCYGETWKTYKNIINYKPTQNRFLDREKTIDIMANYTFVLIIENCNADGYVSEKIYDAMSVGCIPLYYGNNNTDINLPKDCYINLKNIKPTLLPYIINFLSPKMIETIRGNIYKNRMKVLRNASINKYNELLKTMT